MFCVNNVCEHIMMEKLYNFVKKKKSGRPVEYFFIEPVTGNKHIINHLAP